MRAILLLAVAAAVASAQERPAFRANVELVTVPLTVTHRDRNQPVGELAPADFRVREDGVEQQVTLLDHARRPVSLCVVLDISKSMTESRRAIAQAAIDATLAGLAPEDEASVVLFSEVAGVALPWTPATRIPRIPWDTWKPVGGTALLDALKVALEMIDGSRNARPVVLIVSDGGENFSNVELGAIVRTRRQGETLTYAYQPGYPENERKDPDTMRASPLSTPGSQPGWAFPSNAPFSAPEYLRELVGDSGGTVLLAREQRAVPETVRTFLDELNAQYTLGYVPKKVPDGKYRKLKVEARNKDLRVRHRGGYLAMPKS